MNVYGAANSVSEHNMHQEVRQADFFCISGHKSVQEDLIFEEPGNVASNLNGEIFSDPHRTLENICNKDMNGNNIIRMGIRIK